MTDNCFCVGKSEHKVGDFPNMKGRDKESLQAVVLMMIQRRINYMLIAETCLDVVTSMWKVFSIDVYDLLDPSATLCFVTPLITKKIHILPDILNDPFMVSTPVG